MAKEPIPFSLRDVNTLKEGVLAEEAGFKPLSKLGVDFTLRPETVFGVLPAVGGMVNIGQLIGKVQTEDAANRLLGKDVGFGQTLKETATKGSATNQVIQDIKDFKAKDDYSTSPNITRDDIQNYIRSTRPDLDLAPIQIPTYTKKQLSSRSTDFSTAPQSYTVQPFSSDAEFRSSGFRGNYSGPEMLRTETGELDAPTGRTYGQAFKSGDLDRGLKSVSDFAEDNINQTNISNMKGYDPAFARAVTKENQGDAPSSDPTFICTVLFDLNDMPMSIYKYDQRYGQQVNKKIYNGYAIWGKPMAERMRNKGILYKIMKPIALRWAEQMAFDMSKGKVGKKRYTIKIMKFLGEAICYGLGLFIKPEGEKDGTRNRDRQHAKERGTVSRKDGVLKKRGRPRVKRRTAS
tara:strand:- start:713 stop:1927 length:1215 start_codon:yes stop_codon:yes gene_type:complete